MPATERIRFVYVGDFGIQREFPADDSGQVQQIVDEPGLQVYVSAKHLDVVKRGCGQFAAGFPG